MVPLIAPTNPITTKGTEPMWGDTTITLVGNLVDDPELRFTPSGDAVARFRLASTPRYLDRQAEEWKDGESLFLTCTAWRQVAENLTESTQRGTRVIVQGRLRQRSYQTDDGNKRTVYEVQVDDVGPSLRHATAKVTKAWRSTGETNGGFGRPAGQSPNDSGAGRWVDTTAMDSWRRQPEPVGAGEPPFWTRSRQ